MSVTLQVFSPKPRDLQSGYYPLKPSGATEGQWEFHLFTHSSNGRYLGNTSRVNALCYKIQEIFSQISHTGSAYFHNICNSFSTDFRLDQSIRQNSNMGCSFLFFQELYGMLWWTGSPVTPLFFKFWNESINKEIRQNNLLFYLKSCSNTNCFHSVPSIISAAHLQVFWLVCLSFFEWPALGHCISFKIRGVWRGGGGGGKSKKDNQQI